MCPYLLLSISETLRGYVATLIAMTLGCCGYVPVLIAACFGDLEMALVI